MAEEVYRWRPVPKKHRCERCDEEATVVVETLYLCGQHFLSETRKRLGVRQTKAS